MKKVYLIAIFILFTILTLNAQHEIWLIGGDTLTIRNYKFNEDRTAISFHAPKQDKQKYASASREKIIIPLEDIFMIVDPEGKEEIFYEIDSINGFTLTKEEMYSYIKGMNKAIYNYKPKPIFLVGGIALGFGSAFLYPIALPNVFLTTVPVAAGTTPAYFVKAPKSMVLVDDEKYNNDEVYSLGYQEIAKEKHLKKALTGGLIGLVSGIVTAAVVGHYGKK